MSLKIISLNDYINTVYRMNYYGQVHITKSESITQLTNKLKDSIIKDIISQVILGGHSINETEINTEVESLNKPLRAIVKIYKKYPDGNIPEEVWSYRWHNELIDLIENPINGVIFSKNKLLYIRPCQVSIDKKKLLTIEFND
jgi:hypothetical protein